MGLVSCACFCRRGGWRKKTKGAGRASAWGVTDLALVVVDHDVVGFHVPVHDAFTVAVV